MSRPPAALVIDASEWYADESWREHVKPRHWRRLPSRANVSVRVALLETQKHGVHATFMVPVALAIHAPELLLEILRSGHEIGLAVSAPWPLDEVPEANRHALALTWRQEHAELENVMGVGIHGFTSSWTVGPGDSWWHTELIRLGFAYDATPIRGSEAVAVVLQTEEPGMAVMGNRFAAWQLDQEQPRLRGLPRRVRATHEELVRAGLERLATACHSSKSPIAESLGLVDRGVTAIDAAPLEQAQSSHDPEVNTDVPRLAIIVPLKDEADGVLPLFRELTALSIGMADVARCEFVIIDDGSVDQTWRLLEQSARKYPRVRLVRHGLNRGIAAAIHSGMQATEAEWVASIDGDLSYDPMELRAMLLKIADAEIVTASPYHPDGGVHNVPEWRLFLSRALSRAYRLLLRRPIYTWTSCFRIYRREFVGRISLRNKGFLGTAELLVRAIRRGGRVVEHPCVLEARLLGFSKMRVLPVILGHLRLLLMVALRLVK